MQFHEQHFIYKAATSPTMRNKLLPLALLVPLLASAATLERGAAELVQSITDELSLSPLEVETGVVALRGTKLTSPFGHKLLQQMRTLMAQNTEDYYSVNARSVTPLTLARSMQGQNSTSVDSAVVDAELSGRYWLVDNDQSLRVRVELRRSADDELIASAETTVATANIADYLPPRAEQLQEQSAELQQLQGEISVSAPEFGASFNHGNGGLYLAGEQFNLVFQAQEDAYVRLLHFDSAGRSQYLNDGDALLAGGKAHVIPKGESWEVDCSAGCGPERILLLVSRAPLGDLRAPRSDQDLSSFIARGLSPSSRQSRERAIGWQSMEFYTLGE